jgi:two-component system NtrC family sensor kinase
LFELIHQYETYYPNPVPAVQNTLEAIDFEFLQDDLPKLLFSMQLGAERIKQIVLSLRTFSRTDEAEFKAVDLHANLDSTLTILEHRLKAQPDRPAITLTKNYGSVPPVKCYAGQLNQVFMNILANAIDAIEEHHINNKISAQPEIQLSTQLSDPNHVRISITDNGIGIPTALRSRLFDPFFTTKSIGKGTGLGLSISYQIVTEKHHGKLYCDSTLGVGSQFCIEIPVQQNLA